MIIDDLLDFTSELGEDNFEEEVFLKSGMVRASVGLYNTQEDIDTLVSALKEIISNTDELCSHYKTDSDRKSVV